MKILVATRNRGKLKEIREILAVPTLELLTVDDLHNLPADVVEDAPDFEGNARKKALEYGTASNLWTLADDSGLEVMALNNAPGVNSARYAGEPSSDTSNNHKLLADLADTSDRRAHFRCVIILRAPDGREWSAEGICPGKIISTPRGTNGFGYDPLFVPDGFDQTFAELDSTTKHKLSHRGKALQHLAANWNDILSHAAQ